MLQCPVSVLHKIFGQMQARSDNGAIDSRDIQYAKHPIKRDLRIEAKVVAINLIREPRLLKVACPGAYGVPVLVAVIPSTGWRK